MIALWIPRVHKGRPPSVETDEQMAKRLAAEWGGGMIQGQSS